MSRKAATSRRCSAGWIDPRHGAACDLRCRPGWRNPSRPRDAGPAAPATVSRLRRTSIGPGGPTGCCGSGPSCKGPPKSVAGFDSRARVSASSLVGLSACEPQRGPVDPSRVGDLCTALARFPACGDVRIPGASPAGGRSCRQADEGGLSRPLDQGLPRAGGAWGLSAECGRQARALPAAACCRARNGY